MTQIVAFVGCTFLYTLCCIARALVADKYRSEYSELGKFIIYALVLLLVILSEVKLGKFRFSLVGSFALLIFIVIILCFYPAITEQWMNELIFYSFLFLCFPTIVSLFVLALDQVEPVIKRYHYALFLSYFAYALQFTINGIVLLLDHYGYYWNKKTLYFLDFIPIIVMFSTTLLALLIFRTNIHRVDPTKVNVIVQMSKCYKYARRSYQNQEEGRHQSFFDIAVLRCGHRIVSDLKRLYALLMIIPLFFISSIAYMEVERWIYLVRNGRLEAIPDDQYELAVVVAQISTIPVGGVLVYLLTLKCTPIFKTHLRRMFLGALLLVFGILYYMLIHVKIENTQQTVSSSEGRSAIILVNTFPHDIEFMIPSIALEKDIIKAMNYKALSSFTLTGSANVSADIKFVDDETTQDVTLFIQEKRVFCYYFEKRINNPKYFEFTPDMKHRPRFRILANVYNHFNLHITCPYHSYTYYTSKVIQKEIRNEKCEVFKDENQKVSAEFKPGGRYLILVYEDEDNNYTIAFIGFSDNWNVGPGEIFGHLIFVELSRSIFITYGVCWMYMQGPMRLKQLFIYAFWTLDKTGNLVEYIFFNIMMNEVSMSVRCSILLGCCTVGLICFGILCMFYEYPAYNEDRDIYPEDEEGRNNRSREGHRTDSPSGHSPFD